MSFADITRRLSKFTIDNSPNILTAMGAVGAVTTAVLAGKASFEAADIIRLKEGVEGTADDPKERIKERVQLVWRLYIPTVTMGAATVACIFGANRVSARRAAGIAAAYSIVEKTADEYRKKVVETIGERKEEAIRDEIAQDRLNNTYIDDVKLIDAGVGELCYDKFSDRYFRATVEGLRAAENSLNFSLIHDGYASLAEFYRILELDAPVYAEQIGWNSDRMLEIRIGSRVAPGDIPSLVLDFKTEPRPDYGRFRG